MWFLPPQPDQAPLGTNGKQHCLLRPALGGWGEAQCWSASPPQAGGISGWDFPGNLELISDQVFPLLEQSLSLAAGKNLLQQQETSGVLGTSWGLSVAGA